MLQVEHTYLFLNKFVRAGLLCLFLNVETYDEGAQQKILPISNPTNRGRILWTTISVSFLICLAKKVKYLVFLCISWVTSELTSRSGLNKIFFQIVNQVFKSHFWKINFFLFWTENLHVSFHLFILCYSRFSSLSVCLFCTNTTLVSIILNIVCFLVKYFSFTTIL